MFEESVVVMVNALFFTDLVVEPVGITTISLLAQRVTAKTARLMG